MSLNHRLTKFKKMVSPKKRVDAELQDSYKLLNFFNGGVFTVPFCSIVHFAV